MYPQSLSSWDREAVAKLERELTARRREYQETHDPDQRANLGRRLANLEGMLPVVRQMARLMETIEQVTKAGHHR